jgi:hypothetical protein
MVQGPRHIHDFFATGKHTMIDELEISLATILGKDTAHIIRRMIDARQLIESAWDDAADSPQDGDVGTPTEGSK